MSKRNFNTTLVIDQSPDQVFDAIKNVRGWWEGKIDGSAAEDAVRGRRTLNVVPLGNDSTSTEPRWARTISRTM